MRARFYARFPLSRRFGVIVSTPVFTRRPTEFATTRRSIVPGLVALAAVLAGSLLLGHILSVIS